MSPFHDSARSQRKCSRAAISPRAVHSEHLTLALVEIEPDCGAARAPPRLREPGSRSDSIPTSGFRSHHAGTSSFASPSVRECLPNGARSGAGQQSPNEDRKRSSVFSSIEEDSGGDRTDHRDGNNA